MLSRVLSSQSGNALWFILIAIVLIGALTMLLTRGASSVSQSGDVEQSRIRASQIMRYAQGLQSAIEQMRDRGVSESDISFQNTTTVTNYTNAHCAQADCKLFDINGGGQEYRKPPEGVNDGSEWIFTGANNVGSASGPVGTTAAVSGNDLIMLLPNANSDLCAQINRDMGIGIAGAIPEDHTGLDLTPFTGTYANTLNVIEGDPAPFELDGKTAGCFINKAVNPAVTYFYYVLLAR